MLVQSKRQENIILTESRHGGGLSDL
jgi:hypothetical protein